MKRRICFAFALVLIFANVVLVYADYWVPPWPFYVVSSDGSRVFHVTPTTEQWPELMDEWADYPPTGLYYNTYPLTPIYFVENPCWALWEQDFIFSIDMQYFVWVPQKNASSHNFHANEATALVFYANGKMQKTYMLSDLMMNLDAISWTTTTAWWIDYSFPSAGRDISLNTQNNHLTVRTVDHQTFIFDITNGEIVRHHITVTESCVEEVLEYQVSASDTTNIGTVEHPTPASDVVTTETDEYTSQFPWFQLVIFLVFLLLTLGQGIVFWHIRHRRNTAHK